jgi:D-methionine transport system ATP-binding protein
MRVPVSFTYLRRGARWLLITEGEEQKRMNEIKVEHLTKYFTTKEGRVEALKDINLNIKAGDIFGIIGMSGAGKSTLVRCLNYLERPSEGRVLVAGKELGAMSVVELRRQRRDIAMIFQHFNLLMQKNVVDNVCFPLRIQGVSRGEARKKAKELLQIVGLSEKASAYPSQLSGGQKQRVAIARALASDPKILLCDEATSALDPQTTASILALLKEINKNLNLTIVIITHQMAVIQEICSHVAIIEAGELAEYGLVEEIFSHPKSKAAREMIIEEKQVGEWEGASRQIENLIEGRKIRIVFSENSAFEPVIANMILKFGIPVNILKADTKNVNGIAKGEMILGLPKAAELQEKIVHFLLERGLELEEVTEDVD